MTAAKEPKLVRLTNSKTGVVVQTTEDNAGRLSGFEPEKATSKSTPSSKSSDK